MRKVIRVYKKYGLCEIVNKMLSGAVSSILQRRFLYASGFFIDHSTRWNFRSRAIVGVNFRAGRRCRIEAIEEHGGIIYNPMLIIGDNVSMNDDVHIGCSTEIHIGSNVLMASKIYISDHDHGYYGADNSDSPASLPNRRGLYSAPVFIGDNVWIGEMVCILPGVRIGSGSIIGAGAIVSKDIPENCIAVGVPAKVVKIYNEKNGVWERDVSK